MADADKDAHLSPRHAGLLINPFRHLNTLWTGASEERSISDESALLQRYVRLPYKLGRVPVALPSLGLGTQYINTIDINSAITDEPPLVWLHGAGGGLERACRASSVVYYSCALGPLNQR